jgi:hypothetical protein
MNICISNICYIYNTYKNKHLKAYGIYVLYNAYLKTYLPSNYDNYDTECKCRKCRQLYSTTLTTVYDIWLHSTTSYDRQLWGAQDPFDLRQIPILNDLAISTGMFYRSIVWRQQKKIPGTTQKCRYRCIRWSGAVNLVLSELAMKRSMAVWRLTTLSDTFHRSRTTSQTFVLAIWCNRSSDGYS